MDLLPAALALAESIASPLLWRSLAIHLARQKGDDGMALGSFLEQPTFRKLLVEEKRKVLEHQVWWLKKDSG